MNTNITKAKILKLALSFTFIIVIIFSFKSYHYYQYIKTEVIEDIKKEAHLLEDYMMSVREALHNQFISSRIKLTKETVGFLPAHFTTIVSDKFIKKNNYNYSIRNVSDRARNPLNSADEEELKAIKYFQNQPNLKEYSALYSNKDGEFFQYASPIYIKKYCLQCHGKKENTRATIQKMYDSAYDYKLGDLRGIVSIKIPAQVIETKFFNYVKKEFLLSLLTLVSIILALILVFKKIFSQIAFIEVQANNIASKDPLTGLYNRRFLDMYEKEYENFVEKGLHYTVAFLDIDNFKNINDTFGHDVGDLVLKEFASTLNALSHKDDIVCRYGGEEFLIIMNNISLEKATEKLEQIRLTVENKKLLINNETINITVSIGLDIGSANDLLQDTINNADKALYQAKNSGKNKLLIFEHI